MIRPAWLALLLLAGCAGGTGSAPQACDLRRVAEIPLRFDRGFVAAPATIDDHAVTLLIDTGSERSLVTPAAASTLDLPAVAGGHSIIHGAGGDVTVGDVRLQSFGIGGMEMLDQVMTVAPLPAAGLTGPLASGQLAADWLSDFTVAFDLPAGRMGLYRAAGCGSADIPLRGPTSAVRARVAGRGLLLLPVTLDGQRFTALLDSGANETALSETAAARLGLTAASLAHDRRGESIGIDGAVRQTYAHRFADLRVAGTSFPAPLIHVGPLRLPNADMLLGVDWLRRNRLWIDYDTGEITIQPVP